MKHRQKRTAALLCGLTVLLSAAPRGAKAADGVVLRTCAGWLESAYAEWAPVSGASGWRIYADGKPLDDMLIRQYIGYWRADAVGLKAGTHTLKVVPLIGGKEDSSLAAEQTVTVQAHDRSGFGFVGGSASGAYNDDGTLKSNAAVLYITNANKDSISLDVASDSKGSKTTVSGVQNILTAYQKGYETRPLDLRFIGEITDPAVLTDGDLLLKGSGASKRLSCGVTVEGIGQDTVFNGFGLRIANTSGAEVRNIGFMNCDSGEGDDIGLQQNNDHIWVHNCDLFYGDAGSDADQAKGDGALDTKTSSYITHSYNHFFDSGKCNLQGMKSETAENCITYHHNWYDHSDSRHPRIRTCTVHIYNNYYDGNAKYGIGVTMGASAFAEQNYFRNCPKPMLSSGQGTDAQGEGTFSGETGGIIKSFGNIMTGNPACITYQQNPQSFDVYEASSRNEAVPASVKTRSGDTGYSNFDTAGNMYPYTADAAADVPQIVKAHAGRVQGGDFKWQFDDAKDDASYAVNTALKQALVNYTSPVVSVGSGAYAGPVIPAETTAPAETETAVQTETTAAAHVTPASAYVHNFTENGTASSFYAISGNLSTSKGTVEYAGKTLTQCLKLETATGIGFTAPAAGKLTLVFAEADATIKIDGSKLTASNGIITAVLAAGAHALTKANTANLFYMVFEPVSAAEPVTETEVPPAAQKRGDVDENGKITVGDAVLLARFLANDPTAAQDLSAQGLQNADVNGSGTPDSDDLTAILRHLARLESL